MNIIFSCHTHGIKQRNDSEKKPTLNNVDKYVKQRVVY